MATIKDIAHILTEKYNLNGKDADFFTTSFVETIIEGLTADRIVKIKGLGTFKIQTVKDRSSINVNTGERVLISGHDKINFTPDSALRDLVNRPFAQFETVTLADDVNVDALATVDEEDIEEPAVEPAQEPEPVVVEPEPVAVEPEPVVVEQEPKVNPYVVPIINNVEETPADEEPKVAEETEPVVQEIQPEIRIEEPEIEVNEQEQHPVEPKPEVKVVDELANVESNEEETYDEDDDSISSEEYHHCRKMFFIYATIVTILLAIAAFFAGYYCADYNLFGCDRDAQSVQCPAVKPQVKSPKVVKKATPKPITATKDSTSALAPVKKEDNTNANQQAVPAKQVTSPAKQVTSPAKQVTSPAKQIEEKKPSAMTQYNSDARVRTGAYAIVGTKTTHTVKAGQTASSIAKTYLGPGMECYVEAYNGGRTDFKEGEKIKIPELMLKKRLRK